MWPAAILGNFFIPKCRVPLIRAVLPEPYRNLNDSSFEDIWNSGGYFMLREGIVTGNIHTWCKNCLKYDKNNVNKLLSHITFRPETQQKLLKYIFENNKKYNLKKEDIGVEL
jgi:ABC-type proline/glycine betaine transport system substrate-binding protein